MPGVYFVTTQEPLTGQKTQVTAVFPGRNQSVAVKADNDRKMAEMSVPKKDRIVRFVDQPYSLITPSEPLPPPPPPPPPPHYYDPYYAYHNAYHTHPHPPYFHQLPPLMHQSPYNMMPPFFPTAQPAYQLQVAPQVPWSTPALPPIAMQYIQQPNSAPPVLQQESDDDDDETDYDDDNRTHQRLTDSKRKLRDILLIDDSTVRSMYGRGKRRAGHNKALRVIQESPIYDSGNNIVSSNN